MNDSGLMRVVVLILLAAGLVYMPMSREPSAARTSADAIGSETSSVQRDQDSDERASLIGGDSAHGGDVPDAITLLGDFANIDPTPARIL